MADADGAPPSTAAPPPPKRRRQIRRRAADDDGDEGGAAGAVLEDARALAGLRDKRKGLSADTLLTAPRAAAADGADALLDSSAAAPADAAGLATAYVKESAADAAAAAAAADAEAFVEAELARRMGLPPPEKAGSTSTPADAWRGARDALYAVPDELKGQKARIGGDAEAYGGGAAVVEVALTADEAVRNVERTEAAKRALLGLPPVDAAPREDEAAAAARAARAALPKAFGLSKKGRR